MCAQLSETERRAMGTEAATLVPPQARRGWETTAGRRSVTEAGPGGRGGAPRVPPQTHRGWEPAAGRRSPVDVLAEQEADRLSDLVPVRHGREMISAVTFYRGGADGGSPPGHPGRGAPRPAVRRRPPDQLRSVRLTGAPAGVRRQ